MDIETIGKELAKNVKTQKDMTAITGKLVKAILESALNAELDDHLGYDKNENPLLVNPTLEMASARKS